MTLTVTNATRIAVIRPPEPMLPNGSPPASSSPVIAAASRTIMLNPPASLSSIPSSFAYALAMKYTAGTAMKENVM